MNRVEPHIITGTLLCIAGCGFGCIACAADGVIPVADAIGGGSAFSSALHSAGALA
ncbi:MAG: hypothetical protein ACK5KQ_03560 [Anaerorhabdus sp.]